MVNWLMFDAKTPADADRPGGMGISFDWRLLAGRSWRTALDIVRRLNAGQMSPKQSGSSGAEYVDVSSGVESAPGVKDPALIQHFMDAVRTANQIEAEAERPS